MEITANCMRLLIQHKQGYYFQKNSLENKHEALSNIYAGDYNRLTGETDREKEFPNDNKNKPCMDNRQMKTRRQKAAAWRDLI